MDKLEIHSPSFRVVEIEAQESLLTILYNPVYHLSPDFFLAFHLPQLGQQSLVLIQPLHTSDDNGRETFGRAAGIGERGAAIGGNVGSGQGEG